MRSISNRLTLRIMMVVLATMAVIASLVYFAVGKYMEDEAMRRFQMVVMRVHREIQRRLSDVYVANINNVYEIEHDIDDPDKMYGHMERVVRLNPGIVSCGLLFEPDYYPEKGHCFVPFATRDTADVISVMRIDSVYHDYFDDEWYVERMANNNADWVDPYFETSLLTTHIAPRLLTTHAIPVHNREGRPVGLLCADLSLEDLRNEMLQTVQQATSIYEERQKQHSYSCVIDRNGRYIIHPDKDRMLKDTLDASITFKGIWGAVSTVIDGVPSRINYRVIESTEWTVMMVVPEEVVQQNGRMLNFIILAVMLIGLAAICLFVRLQITKVTSPLHSLTRSAEEVAQGNFNAPLPDIKHNDEIRLLRDSFANMQQSLSQYIEELTTTTAQKTAIESELSIARNLQKAMVPSVFPDREGLDVYASMTPAKEVGGDLYDFFLRDNCLYFCIGDVAGKGVPAALVMTTVCGSFRLLADSESDPMRIVSRISDKMARYTRMTFFVTFFAGVLDLDTGHLRYCNAGHKAPLVDGQPLPVHSNLPIGAIPDWKFEAQETDLAPGSTLFLYTDGLDEAENAQGQMFGKKRIIEVMQTSSQQPRVLIEHMTQAVAEFVGDTEQSDDLTMLCISLNNA
ncbi:MAG: SpoIIE family protein phosphatase [Bacteroidales bacterium]|nr:SpoIIE family protein phosphatase [Bacteroidales bacterium]